MHFLEPVQLRSLVLERLLSRLRQQLLRVLRHLGGLLRVAQPSIDSAQLIKHIRMVRSQSGRALKLRFRRLERSAVEEQSS